MDASGALGAGPGASDMAGGPGRCRREGHGTMMRLRQCWGVEGAHFAPRRSEIYVFPLEIRVPTRPGLERLIGHGQCPRSGEREAPGQSQQASEGGEYGAAEPRPVGTVAEQEGGVGGGPSTAMGLFSTRGPGRTQTGDCIFRASCLSWPYKFFVTRWVL